MTRTNRRFTRQIDYLNRSLPMARGALATALAPGRAWLRVPLAMLLMLGGLFSFLPVLGFWMLPLGLLLLAFDVPRLRPVVGDWAVRGRAWLRRWRR